MICRFTIKLGLSPGNETNSQQLSVETFLNARCSIVHQSFMFLSYKESLENHCLVCARSLLEDQPRELYLLHFWSASSLKDKVHYVDGIGRQPLSFHQRDSRYRRQQRYTCIVTRQIHHSAYDVFGRQTVQDEGAT